MSAGFRVGDERLVKLTPSAAGKVASLLAKQGRPNGVLRVAVVGGGCSGLQYKMDLQDAPANRDILVESGGVRVVVDPEERALRDRQRTGLPRCAGRRVQGEESQRRHDVLVRRELQRVTDYFALLNEPRRPWLEPETLKSKFLALAAEAHPDKQNIVGEARKSRGQPPLR